MNVTTNIEIRRWETQWEELPDTIRRMFSDKEAEFFKGLPYAREELIAGAFTEHFKSFFELFRKNDVYRVYITAHNNDSPRVYFYTSFVMEHDGIAFRLPTGQLKLPGDPPQCVVDLYTHVGGTDERLDYFCGFIEPERIKSIADSAWKVESTRKGDCYSIFSYGNGDSAGYISGGGGFMHSHEEGCLYELDIDSFIKNYFGNFFERRENDKEE